MRLSIHEKAPDFELVSDEGSSVSLSDFHGMWVLLCFYPKDSTPGCTKEVEMLRDAHAELERRDVVVLGISTDSYKSHERFRSKLNLPFALLSDEEKEVSDLYGALNEEKTRSARKSFLIDSDGTLVKIYNHVEPESHAREVLTDLEELQAL